MKSGSSMVLAVFYRYLLLGCCILLAIAILSRQDKVSQERPQRLGSIETPELEERSQPDRLGKVGGSYSAPQSKSSTIMLLRELIGEAEAEGAEVGHLRETLEKVKAMEESATVTVHFDSDPVLKAYEAYAFGLPE